MKSPRRGECLLSFLGIATVFLAALFVLRSAWPIIQFEWAGTVTGDVMLYVFVGRSILNGLVPYVDLFEVRPPGMYLLSALSLWGFGDTQLLTILSIITYILIPAGLALIAWDAGKTLPRWMRLWMTVASVLAGILFSIFLEERAGGSETECIGSLFAVLYAYSLFLRIPHRWRHVATVARGLAMAAAIGTKEPFLLVLLACGMLLSRDWPSIRANVIAPLIVGIMLGTLTLLLLGELVPFLTIYLPVMFGSRLEGASVSDTPLWMRSIDVRLLVGNVTEYTRLPALGLWILGLWMMIPILRERTTKYPLWACLLCSFMMLMAWQYGVLLIAWLYEVLLIAFFYAQLAILLNELSTFSLWVWALYASVGVVVTCIIWSTYPEQWKRHLLPVMVLILICTAVGAGGRYNNYHYAFAVPFYVSVAALFFTRIPSMPRRLGLLITTTVLLSIAALRYTPEARYLSLLQRGVGRAQNAHGETIQRVDALLDACGIDRFVSVSLRDILAFSRHSPIGPITGMGSHDFFAPTHPLYVQTALNMANRADIMFVDSELTEWHPTLANVRDQLFTREAPECTRAFLPLTGIDAYFRRMDVPRDFGAYLMPNG